VGDGLTTGLGVGVGVGAGVGAAFLLTEYHITPIAAITMITRAAAVTLETALRLTCILSLNGDLLFSKL